MKVAYEFTCLLFFFFSGRLVKRVFQDYVETPLVSFYAVRVCSLLQIL